ncbi:MAG: gamma-glutamylcyclotransferase [Bacteroidetes bacterium]|nr:gamma-glutamylcyclotransferase [Bacteroidota bacterium]
MNSDKHFLFSYGTLQLQSVQLANYGRLLTGKHDKLFGYKIEQIIITDPDVLSKSKTNSHPIAVKSSDKNDFIEGMIFEITEYELAQTDKYEVSDYLRVLETFESGTKAWIYVSKE